MSCPSCNSHNVRCINSRSKEDGNRIRTYMCNECKTKYHTKEVLLDVKSADSRGYVPVMGSYVEPKDMLEKIRGPIENVLKVIGSYERLIK